MFKRFLQWLFGPLGTPMSKLPSLKEETLNLNTSISIDDITTAVLRIAKREFDSVVQDTQNDYPGDIEILEKYYNESYNGWGIPGGYDESAGHRWCGVFVAYCCSNLNAELGVGGPIIGLHPLLSKFVMGSTWRIQSGEKWAKTPFDKPRPIPFSEVRRGDIALVRTSGKRKYGDHFTLVESTLEGPTERFNTIYTYEGNATGEIGDGRLGREGVIHHERYQHTIRNLVRLKREWFTGLDGR